MTRSIDISTKRYPQMYVMVDEEDYPRISMWKWYPSKNRKTFYAVCTINFNGKRIYTKMHLFIMGTSPNLLVDHKDGNGLNNTRENLRYCTASQNCMNRRKRRKTNENSIHRSEYKGVYYQPRGKKYVAQIRVNGKLYTVGRRTDEKAAATDYDAAAKKYFGEYAYLNFPESKNAF